MGGSLEPLSQIRQILLMLKRQGERAELSPSCSESIFGGQKQTIMIQVTIKQYNRLQHLIYLLQKNESVLNQMCIGNPNVQSDGWCLKQISEIIPVYHILRQIIKKSQEEGNYIHQSNSTTQSFWSKAKKIVSEIGNLPVIVQQLLKENQRLQEQNKKLQKKVEELGINTNYINDLWKAQETLLKGQYIQKQQLTHLSHESIHKILEPLINDIGHSHRIFRNISCMVHGQNKNLKKENDKSLSLCSLQLLKQLADIIQIEQQYILTQAAEKKLNTFEKKVAEIVIPNPFYVGKRLVKSIQQKDKSTEASRSSQQLFDSKKQVNQTQETIDCFRMRVLGKIEQIDFKTLLKEEKNLNKDGLEDQELDFCQKIILESLPYIKKTLKITNKITIYKFCSSSINRLKSYEQFAIQLQKYLQQNKEINKFISQNNVQQIKDKLPSEQKQVKQSSKISKTQVFKTIKKAFSNLISENQRIRLEMETISQNLEQKSCLHATQIEEFEKEIQILNHQKAQLQQSLKKYCQIWNKSANQNDSIEIITLKKQIKALKQENQNLSAQIQQKKQKTLENNNHGILIDDQKNVLICKIEELQNKLTKIQKENKQLHRKISKSRSKTKQKRNGLEKSRSKSTLMTEVQLVMMKQKLKHLSEMCDLEEKRYQKLKSQNERMETLLLESEFENEQESDNESQIQNIYAK